MGRTLSVDDYSEYAADFLFETSHKMNPEPAELSEARICPRCDGINTEKTMHGANIIGYIRGNGYLDKAGCKRDMNLHHLTGTDDKGDSLDPYGHMRQAGEVDDLALKLKRTGQHDPKTKHFTVPQSEMEEAVTKATKS